MKYFLALLAFFFLTAAVKTQPISISGKITGEARSLIKEIQLFGDGKVKRVPVDGETGAFQGEFTIQEAQFVEIKSGSPAGDFLYLPPGASFELNIDKPSIQGRTLELSEGDVKRLKAVMDRFYSAIDETGINTQGRDWVKKLFGQANFADRAVQAALESLRQDQAFIRGFAPSFEKDFRLFADVFRNYVMIDELSLPEIEKELEALSKSGMPVTALTIPFYREYLTALTNAYAARKLENYDLELEFSKQGYIAQHLAAEACVKYIPNQHAIDFLLNEKLSRELAVNGIKHKNYVDFLFTHASEKITGQYTEKYNQLKEKTSGNATSERPDAFDFTLHDADGKEYRLADFKGKMLFIDFWASWCAPCKAQMPYIKELEEHYAGKDIVFASVSLDNTKKAWLKGVADENLHGVVLHAEGAFKNPFPAAYGIQAIPRFMLIDAEGKLISDNMPRPQDKKEVMAMIDADLYKKELNGVLTSHFKALGVEQLMSGKTIHFKSTRSFPGVIAHLETWYSHPHNYRNEYYIEENPQFTLMLGADFFKKRQTIVTADTIIASDGNLPEAAQWRNNLFGLDLFLLRELEQLELDFAPENAANTDNQYVIQAINNGNITKYFIDKSDMLIKQVLIVQRVEPRSGGGVMNASTKYEDYQSVNGLMIPHTINMNNMLITRVKEAELTPINTALFEGINE